MFEAAERGRQAHYKLTSTIMLQMTDRTGSSRANKDEGKHGGEVTLSGSMTRQWEQDFPLLDATSHITNTGKMVEELEIKMRNMLQEVRRRRRWVRWEVFLILMRLGSKVYFGKTRDVVFDLRSLDDLEKARRQRELQKELVGFIKRG